MSFGIKQAERDLGIDIDGDGIIGGPVRGGAHANMVNQMERMTGVDLNGDGRIGGAGCATQQPRMGGVTSYQTYSHYSVSGSGTGHIPGGSALNQMERMTGMDLNGDGRIGGARR